MTAQTGTENAVHGATIRPKALELLEVMWYKNQLYVAGTFNRRLCMYRLLALFATERFGLIKVRVKHHEDLKSKLAQCFTTECEGHRATKSATQSWAAGDTSDSRFPPFRLFANGHLGVQTERR
eukprot:g32003.t1